MYCGGYLIPSESTHFRDLQETWLNEARDSVQDRFKKSNMHVTQVCHTAATRTGGEENEDDTVGQASREQRERLFENYTQSYAWFQNNQDESEGNIVYSSNRLISNQTEHDSGSDLPRNNVILARMPRYWVPITARGAFLSEEPSLGKRAHYIHYLVKVIFLSKLDSNTGI